MKLTHSNSRKSIILNGRTYKAYNICELPNNFGFHDKEPVIALRAVSYTHLTLPTKRIV